MTQSGGGEKKKINRPFVLKNRVCVPLQAVPRGPYLGYSTRDMFGVTRCTKKCHSPGSAQEHPLGLSGGSLTEGQPWSGTKPPWSPRLGQHPSSSRTGSDVKVNAQLMLTRAVLPLRRAFGAGEDEGAHHGSVSALTVGAAQGQPQIHGSPNTRTSLEQPEGNVTTHLPANTLKHHSTPLQQS